MTHFAGKLMRVFVLSVLSTVLLAGFYLRDSSAFLGLLPNVLGKFSLFGAFSAFAIDHVFDVPGVLLYLSLAALLIFLTVQVVQRRRWN